MKTLDKFRIGAVIALVGWAFSLMFIAFYIYFLSKSQFYVELLAGLLLIGNAIFTFVLINSAVEITKIKINKNM